MQKQFVNLYGKPNNLHTDNGKKFRNNLLNTHCDENNIKHIYGLPYHPQSRGCVEVYNKEIKRLISNKYIENPKKLSLNIELPEANKIYNNNVHSSSKYTPTFLFNCKDEVIFN